MTTPGFFSYLWHSDEFLSALNRVGLSAATAVTTWAAAKGYLGGESVLAIGTLVLAVSQGFSSWNRHRLSAKASGEAARMVGTIAETLDQEVDPVVWERKHGPEWRRIRMKEEQAEREAQEKRAKDLAHVDEADQHNGVKP